MSRSFSSRREGEAPYVRGHFLWGNGADFAEHAVRFLHKSRKALGDIFTIRLLNQYLTIIMDPHCFEQVAKEKNFDFDGIQKQVNMNVFSFELKEARKMITEAGKKVNGKYLSAGLENFTKNLTKAFQKLEEEQAERGPDLNSNASGEKRMSQDGLRSLSAKTLFDALFYTIFGRAKGAPEVERFNPASFCSNFDIFHKVFNYLWLGLPVNMFPKACEALKVLSQQPTAHEMMNREGVSEYIKFSTNYMLQRGQTTEDIVGHNLVFLHVNYNSFRVNFWCMYHLLEKAHVRQALLQELQEAIEARREPGSDEVGFTIEEFDKLPLLGE